MSWVKVDDPTSGGRVEDFSTIKYSPALKISGIPVEAERYRLGPRSALSWIIDQYRVKVDRNSGIVSDPNELCDYLGNPRYIVDLIGKVATVAVETMRIVDSISSAPDETEEA